MAPKKAAGEKISLRISPEKEVTENHEADGPEEVRKAVRKVPPHPPVMEMVKEALTELDQRKGVSAQAIRAFIKEKYASVDEARLKPMLRKALVKGVESGVFVRPANSMTTGAQGSFRLAVRKPKPSKNKEAKENTNPNISKAGEPKAKSGDVKTKKTKSAVEKDGQKKVKKNDVLASKVAPAKKPKAKRTGATADGEPEPETQKISRSKGERGETSSVKKRGKKKAAQKAGDGSDGGSKEEDQKPEGGGNEAESAAQKKGGKRTSPKGDGEPKGPRSSGKKAAEK